MLSGELVEKIGRLALDADSFAFFLIDAQGTILDRGGELDRLDLEHWQIGEGILEQALFLHGYLPLASGYESIVCYQLSDEIAIDVHLFDDDIGTVILLIDRSKDTEEEARVRQQRNEARLRQRYARPRDSQ